MSETGFTVPDGTDLSGIFEPYTSPDVKADETGFTVFNSNLDLNSVFAKNTSGTYKTVYNKHFRFIINRPPPSKKKE